MPRISVILPVFNAGRTLNRAIDSILAQTIQDFEVLVIDDGSTDSGFRDLAASHAGDPRLRFIGPRQNSGPSVARNVGIDASAGEWIALLDADDAWAPGRLQELLAASSGADLVADNIMRFDVGAGEVIGPMFDGFCSDLLTVQEHVAERAGSLGDTGFLKPLIRRDFLDQRQLRYDPDLRHGEDFLLYLVCLCERGKFKLIKWCGYIYTVAHGDKSGEASPYSHTVHSGAAMAAKIDEVLARYGPRLTASEHASVSAKAAVLRRIDPWWDFQAAVRAGRFRAGLRIFRKDDFVRTRAASALCRRLRAMLSLRGRKTWRG